jgi:hypothetical protein
VIDRLVLRGWEESDFEAHAAMSADQQGMRDIPGVLGPRHSLAHSEGLLEASHRYILI